MYDKMAKKLALVYSVGILISGGYSVCLAADDTAPYVLSPTEVHILESEHVGESFEIHVQVPLSLEGANERFPALYVTDSNKGVLFNQISADLQLGSEVPRFISVGIGYPLEHRMSALAVRRRDLTPNYWNLYTDEGKVITSGIDRLVQGVEPIADSENSGGGPAFLKFIQDELIPFIDSTYPTETEDRAYYGHSLGGLFGLYTLFEAPNTFNRYIISSPPTFWDNEAMLDRAQSFVAKIESLNARVYLSVGALEEGGAQLAEGRAVTNNLRLESILRAGDINGLQVKNQVFPDESHLSVRSIAFSRGLRFIYDKPSFPFYFAAFANQ